MKSSGPIEKKVAYSTIVGAVVAGITEAAAFYHWFTPPPPALTAAIVAAVSGIAGWLAPHTSRLRPVTPELDAALEAIGRRKDGTLAVTVNPIVPPTPIQPEGKP